MLFPFRLIALRTWLQVVFVYRLGKGYLFYFVTFLNVFAIATLVVIWFFCVTTINIYILRWAHIISKTGCSSKHCKCQQKCFHIKLLYSKYRKILCLYITPEDVMRIFFFCRARIKIPAKFPSRVFK
jgi:hypothetical protein